MIEFNHISVLKEESLNGLALKDNGVYFDGTLGGAGHSYEILKRVKNSYLVATDLDDNALEVGSERLKEFEGRFTLVKDNFKNFINIKNELNIPLFDGILLDLGMSSHQIDEKDRGFSYMVDAPLDMRMDRKSEFSAENVVNEYSESELKRILYEYGEEDFAPLIARNIVKEREKKRITTTGELVEILDRCIPKFKRKQGHVAKKTFQALRIEVNGELDGLEEVIYQMVRSLKKGGRIAIITFHSLEDRIVKRVFKDLETDCICDKSLPVCVCGKVKEIELVNKKPIVASALELEQNSRAKSAKLRIAEKI